MATPTIVRKSFNGGEIAPILHYRSDLEQYHNSCKSLQNMMVTPWGAATRRPPTAYLETIDTETYGVPVKYIPFRFSISEIFHIIFTDGSGSASPDSDTADLIVFDANGALQTLEGASTKILDTVYDPNDLENVHLIQVNDFVYLTCGGDYPVQFINRYFDPEQSANRWKIGEFILSSGPLGELNENESSLLTITVDDYDVTETYSDLDVVKESDTVHDVASVGLVFWKKVPSSFGAYRFFYKVRVTLDTDHSYESGDTIKLDNIVISSVTNWTWTTNPNKGALQVGTDLSGLYTVLEAGTTKILTLDFTIMTYRSTLLAPPSFPVANISSATVTKPVVSQGFYQSTQDSNTGNLLTDTDYWRPLEVYQGEVNVEANVDLFTEGDVGRVIAVENDQSEILKGNWDLNSTEYTSEVINAQGTVVLTTEGGAWDGLLELQESKNGGGTWKAIGSIRSQNGSTNGSLEREINGINSIIRVRLTEAAKPAATFDPEACIWSLSFSATVMHYTRILNYIDARNVTAQTLSPLVTSVTDHRWRLEEFCESRGYPNTLAVHGERMVFGGSKAKPNTVWASKVNNWQDFIEGDLDTSPYTFTIQSNSYDLIRWIRSTRDLMIGTENAECTMSASSDSEAITPANIKVETQTYFGSDKIQAAVTADLVFFVMGDGKRVRSTQYDFGTDQYLSSEMSILAEHITQAGIKEMSFRRHPFSNIFFVMEDGNAVSFTYERDNQVKGWSRIEVGGSGEIISAASNYSASGDIVAGIVKRGSAYFLESFGANEDDTVFLDSQVQFVDEDYSAGVSVPWSSATGLTVIRDDVELEETTDYTISAGTLTIPAHTDGTVTVGYKFEFEVEPTDFIEMSDHGRQRRISKLSLYLLGSGGCTVSVNDTESPFKDGDSLAAGSLLTGEYQFSVGGGTSSSTRLKLSGNHHKPFNLSAIGFYGQVSR
jgi:hypothetical protein